jgi:hypothetical protein
MTPDQKKQFDQAMARVEKAMKNMPRGETMGGRQPSMGGE